MIPFTRAWWFIFGLCIGATVTSLLLRSFII